MEEKDFEIGDENIETDNSNSDNSNSENTKGTKNILNIVYLIILVSIAIGAWLYMSQNKSTEIDTSVTDTIQVEEKSITDDSFGNDDIVINNGSDTETTINDNTTTSTGITTSSSGETKSIEDKKNEEAIIKDFEKELDSLFDVIDQNGN